MTSQLIMQQNSLKLMELMWPIRVCAEQTRLSNGQAFGHHSPNFPHLFQPAHLELAQDPQREPRSLLVPVHNKFSKSVNFVTSKLPGPVFFSLRRTLILKHPSHLPCETKLTLASCHSLLGRPAIKLFLFSEASSMVA